MTVIMYAANESEQEVSSVNWTPVASVSKTLETPGEHMIWVNAEYAGVNVDEVVGVRVLIDGDEASFDHFEPRLANQFRTFSPFGMKNFNVGTHEVSLEARCLDATQTVKVRRVRLLVMKH